MTPIHLHKSLLSIGSNIGNRVRFIKTSLLEIEKNSVHIVKRSRILETKPIGVINQPDFLNCVVLIETTLTPIELLDTLQQIEMDLGRVKRFDKGPREIDLDILTYDELVMNTDRLTLPHHSIQTRPFIKELLEDLKLFTDPSFILRSKKYYSTEK